jgi:DNA-binding transcriptional MerR regulator
MPAEREMSIGTMARETGLTPATINFYVREGILPPPRKLSRTRAAYSERHLRLLRLVRRLQAAGHSLAQVRRAFDFFGTDPDGIARMEGIGSLQPLPPPFGDPSGEPIEHFEPVDRATLLARHALRADVVDVLERWGVLRPREAGYDARDLWVARNVQGLVEAGIPLEALAYQRRLVAPLREAARVAAILFRRDPTAFARRERRFRDLIAPLQAVEHYLYGRLFDEANPGWQEVMVEEAAAPTAAPAPPGRSGSRPRASAGRGSPRRSGGARRPAGRR